MGDRLRQRIFYGWVIVFVLMGMFALSSGSRYTYGVVLKTLSEQFGWERSALSAVVSISLILVSAFQILSGWLADRLGARLTLTVGFAISTAALFGMSFVSELWQVYLIYGVLGAIGFALASPVASTALVNRWFHTRSRGTALSLATSGVAIGQLTMTPLAAYWLVHGGWQLSYRAIAAVMGFMALPIVGLLLRNAPAEQTTTVSTSAHSHVPDERKTSLREAMRTATFWELMVGVFSCGFTMGFASLHFVAYANDMGMDEMIAGEALGLSGAFSILGAIIMGQWSDHIGRRIPLGVTYTLRALSFVILLFANNELTLFIFAVILGLSWTATTPLSAAVTAEAWGQRSAGFLFGVVFTFMTLGHSIGSYLSGLDYDLVHNYTAAIIAGSVIAGLGALASFAIREHRAKVEVQPVPSPALPAIS